MPDPRPVHALAPEIPMTPLALTPGPLGAADACPWCGAALAPAGPIACPNPACPIRGLDLDDA